MSQNGKLPSSSITRLSISSTNATELSDNQRLIINKCTNIIQDFRAGRVSKSKVSILLQQSIPQDDSNEDQFLSTYEPYFKMLDNFEHYQRGNIERIDNVQQHIAGTLSNEQGDTSIQPTNDTTFVRPSKQLHSLL